MYIAKPDRTSGENEWRPFAEAQGFGHLVAAGRGREVPVVVPTQYVLEGDLVLLHLAAVNPLFEAIGENPNVVLSIAGDWAFIPSDWKVIGDEDPAMGIPTTYYGAVQLVGQATVEDDPGVIAKVLRRQLEGLQPATTVADPLTAHASKLRSIRAIVIAVQEVRAKFKYGGNVDADHRRAVVERLLERNGPGDSAAAAHTLERLSRSRP